MRSDEIGDKCATFPRIVHPWKQVFSSLSSIEFSLLVAAVSGAYCVDPTRIYATGFSQGAGTRPSLYDGSG